MAGGVVSHFANSKPLRPYRFASSMIGIQMDELLFFTIDIFQWGLPLLNHSPGYRTLSNWNRRKEKKAHDDGQIYSEIHLSKAKS